MEKYKNPFIDDSRKSLWKFLQWRITRQEKNRGKKEAPFISTDLKQIYEPASDFQILWIGHSTLLIQCKGLNILTDPVFSKRCSPLAFAGPKRLAPPAISLKHLPKIDYVVISHNHYDHLDQKTVHALGNSVKWLIPMGLKRWFHRIHIDNVIELNWWDSFETKKVKFTCTPAQHWSKRKITDDFETLWSSWAIQIEEYKSWFAGDTGYNPYQFKEIGQKLGPFNFAAIPIGGYEPRWFMKKYHINPEEAVKIHLDVRSELSLGFHWGTFKLTDEPINEPPILLEKAKEKWGVGEDKFLSLPIGEIIKVS